VRSFLGPPSSLAIPVSDGIHLILRYALSHCRSIALQMYGWAMHLAANTKKTRRHHTGAGCPFMGGMEWARPHRSMAPRPD